MFKFDPLAKIRKWLTKDKTVTTEGKYFADAVAVKELSDLIDGSWTIVKKTEDTTNFPTSSTVHLIDTCTVSISGLYYIQYTLAGTYNSSVHAQITDNKNPETTFVVSTASWIGSPTATISWIVELNAGDTLAFKGACSVATNTQDRTYRILVARIK